MQGIDLNSIKINFEIQNDGFFESGLRSISLVVRRGFKISV